MTGTLMVYASFVALLFGGAAWATEPALAVRGWPRRFLWALAMVASLGFPMAMALVPHPPSTPPVFEEPSQSSGPMAEPVAPWTSGGPAAMRKLDGSALTKRETSGVARSIPVHLDSMLAGLWIATSFALVTFYTCASIALRRRARAWPREWIDGGWVRISDTTGPAVMGFIRPEIVLPRSIAAGEPATRTLVLVHERAHIAARDPWLLLGALVAVAMAPWNLPLWWQLRRLRFALEIDCDSRVVQGGTDPRAYGAMLLAVSQRRGDAPLGAIAVTERPRHLERRLRVLLGFPPRHRAALAVAGGALALSLVVGATQVSAPPLAVAQADLRKRPPEDLRPAAVAARTIARARFPELFDRPFEGTAVVAVVFNRDGSVQLANSHKFRPGVMPSDFDLTLENQQLEVDPEEDRLYGAGESPDWTIGPWLASRNAGRLFIVYEVLKWPHDPLRTRARVQAAVAAYDPTLLEAPPPDQKDATTQLTVFMNDNGTVDRALKRDIPVGHGITDEDVEERFTALGITRVKLGRRGFAFGLGVPSARRVVIDYAWPRHSEDPADVDTLNVAWREIDKDYPPRQDVGDDTAIVERYFPDVARRGREAVTEHDDGERRVSTPWILFGRDGVVWDTGLWHSERDRAEAGAALQDSVEARYPGLRVNFAGGGAPWRVQGVPIACLWVAPDSPVQTKAEVDFSRRQDLLMTGAFVYKQTHSPTPQTNRSVPFVLHFSRAMNFNTATGIRQTQNREPVLEVTATDSNDVDVRIAVRVREPLARPGEEEASGAWSPAANLRVPYGRAGKVELLDTFQGQRRPIEVILRPERLSRG